MPMPMPMLIFLSISLTASASLFTAATAAGVNLNNDPNPPFEFDGAASAETQMFRDSVRRAAAARPAILQQPAVAEGDAPPGINPLAARVQLDSKCTEPLERGNGSAEMARFFFDAKNATCRKFTYTGDGGNENNFETELDCLNDCYTGVGEGEPVHEEDVVFIGRSTDDQADFSRREMAAASPDCLLPKDVGNCTGSVQNFYFLPDWQSCVAFKYTGCGGNANRFASRIECEQSCLVADGSVCRGPSGAAMPLQSGADCASTVCPSGTVCAMGFGAPECCEAAEAELLTQVYAPTCANGAQAGGHFGEYFVATFATACADLECAPGERCALHGAGEHAFAKCCQHDKQPQLLLLRQPKSLLPVISERRV